MKKFTTGKKGPVGLQWTYRENFPSSGGCTTSKMRSIYGRKKVKEVLKKSPGKPANRRSLRDKGKGK